MRIRIMMSAALAFCLVACAPTRPPADLYQQLGGDAGVDRFVTVLIDYLYADERIAFLFEETDRENLHEKIVEQICFETGGGCEYTGLPMDEAHSGFEIKHSEMDAFVEDFILAMEDMDYPTTTQNHVLAIFAPMRADVVYK